MVSMLPATDARIFKISGGNEQLPQRLLEVCRPLEQAWAHRCVIR